MKYKIYQKIYTSVFKPVFFRIDPEDIHDRMLRTAVSLGKSKFARRITEYFFRYKHPILEQNLLGIDFSNPIGLSAGFDKNAQLIQIMPSIGFGFVEVGSVTGEPCAGNSKPRLWRLKKSQSLLVYYGLKNDGAEAISKRLDNLSKGRMPYGISIAKTNSVATVDTDVGVADYVKAYKTLKRHGSYVTINISCPNAFGGEPFIVPEKLEKLLQAIDVEKKVCPLFLKLSPDLTEKQLDAIIAVANKHEIDGFICSNLTKARENNPQILDDVPVEHGGMSGRVSCHLSTQQIRRVYKKTEGKYLIIASGGVDSAEVAYEKIKAGASLLQLITGMIYFGPGLIGKINKELVVLLKRDGYASISEAVGSENKK